MEQITSKNFDNLNEWLKFCEQVLSHTDRGHIGDNKQDGESKENSERYYSRFAVGEFIEGCLKKDMDLPVSDRGQLAKLLEMLCTQFDWRLDQNLNQGDPIVEGINNTRSRALETLIKFGIWLRKRDLESEVSRVTTILEKRFASETECPLTLPEYAILGKIYNRIFDLQWGVGDRAQISLLSTEVICPHGGRHLVVLWAIIARLNAPLKFFETTLILRCDIWLTSKSEISPRKSSGLYRNLRQH